MEVLEPEGNLEVYAEVEHRIKEQERERFRVLEDSQKQLKGEWGNLYKIVLKERRRDLLTKTSPIC
jgi:hypothetical protein